jgi:repressor LexA
MIVRFAWEFGHREGHSPSLREIAEGAGLAALTVSCHWNRTEFCGVPRDSCAESFSPPAPARAGEVEVPLIGQIPAGVPLDAVELAVDSFWLPRRLVGHGTLFMLKVKGDSMTGAAVADGDLIVIRQQPVAENGEIVAARPGGTSTGEATVKTLPRLDGHAWLMPQPIPADGAVILGKVVAVVRRARPALNRRRG